jgi:hypothetical protein
MYLSKLLATTSLLAWVILATIPSGSAAAYPHQSEEESAWNAATTARRALRSLTVPDLAGKKLGKGDSLGGKMGGKGAPKVPKGMSTPSPTAGSGTAEPSPDAGTKTPSSSPPSLSPVAPTKAPKGGSMSSAKGMGKGGGGASVPPPKEPIMMRALRSLTGAGPDLLFSKKVPDGKKVGGKGGTGGMKATTKAPKGAKPTPSPTAGADTPAPTPVAGTESPSATSSLTTAPTKVPKGKGKGGEGTMAPNKKPKDGKGGSMKM